MHWPLILNRRRWPASSSSGGIVRRSTQAHLASVALLAIASAVSSQQVTVREEMFHGRHAFVLENEQMRISVLSGGGFIGEIRFKSTDPNKNINPMRVPHYRTIDPYTYDVVKHGDLYGTGTDRRLMSGYMGHFLAFPQFLESSPAEFRQDYGVHGEALAVQWKARPSDASSPQDLLMYADLPKTQFRVERRIFLPPDETVAYVTETVENMVRYDRPIQWVQHVTFGPPFVALNKTFADASVDHVLVGDGPKATLGAWPQSTNSGHVINYRQFTGHSSVWLMDRSKSRVYFTLYNREYKVLIGYIFDSATNPWILDWQENQQATEKPWDGKVIARGICIGDSVISGIRDAVVQGTMFGVPTYSWIEARQRRVQRYAFFLVEIPIVFQGVADLRVEGGKITITERNTGKLIAIKSSHIY
jgi:hypothetical protein